MLNPVDNRTIRSLGRRLSKGEAVITKTGDLWIVMIGGDESYCIPIEVRPSWKQFLPRRRRVVAVQESLSLPVPKKKRKKTISQMVREWIAKGWWWA